MILILHRLYVDGTQYFSSTPTEEPIDLTPAYFREVLLSYRLIFGQDASSARTYRTVWKTSSSPTAPNPRSPNPILPVSNQDIVEESNSDAEADPLLQLLCGQHWKTPNAFAFYRDIDAETTSPYYYPESDFPFLRRRILNLQAFVQGRSPHSLKSLWHDKRNVTFWWTFWVSLPCRIHFLLAIPFATTFF